MIIPTLSRVAAALSVLLLVSCGQQASSPPTLSSVKLTGHGNGPVVTDGRWVWVPNMDDATVTKVDARSDRVVSTIPVGNPKDLFDQGVDTVEKFAAWKRPDGKRAILGVSSLGGTSHLWSHYFMESMGLADKVTWVRSPR